jgi:hypothetical protein
MLEIRLGTEFHVIQAFGFEPSEIGMLAYRQTMSALLRTSTKENFESIQGLDNSIWTVILNRAFDIAPDRIDVIKARHLIFNVTSFMQQSTFLTEMKSALNGLGKNSTNQQKNDEIQNHLLKAWMKVLPNYGYHGEAGYVSFQAALIENSSDPHIASMIQSALIAVNQHAETSVDHSD